MRTEYTVTCDCGHKGKILLKENDQPYSSSWESYTLENLDGSSYTTTTSTWDEVFAKMNVTCPACKKNLTPQNLN